MQYDDIPREELEKEILDFFDSTSGKVYPNPGPQSCGINHRTSLVLATSYDDEPRATPLEFFNEGLTIFIFGEPGGKIANIKRNPKVCAAIYEQPLDHSKTQRSIQIWGKAELISVRNDKTTYMEKVDKWNLRKVGKKMMFQLIKDLGPEEQEKEVEKMLGALNLIRIEPTRMVLRKYTPEFTMPKKYEWNKE
ncbi:MAG: pyridoxamine 5'-phosphate oxidase family protein [Deltaproteobacteria bacterium]|nr:pyridoxamine 5'-phosphate oxidase family protein [Deltaproteobacteria bacterium]